MMSSMMWVDVVIVVAIVFSMLTGLIRGFIKELISIGVWIVGIWLSMRYWSALAVFLQAYVHDPMMRRFLAFIVVIVATFIAGSLLNAILGMLLKRTGLSGADRFLGMGFGFLRGVFVVTLVMLVIQLTGRNTPIKSIFYPYFQPLVHRLSGFEPEFMRHVQGFEQHET